MKISGSFFILTILFASPLVLASSVESTDKETGMARWDWQDGGVSIRLIQRIPDQTRAFFIGRGFNRQQVDMIANTCVFQTIFRNNSNAQVELNLEDWSARAGTQEHPLKLERLWQAEWEKLGVAKGPRIAFRYALFPNIQAFAPGDWNMGMTTWPVSPGSTVDLHLRWRSDDQAKHAVFENIHCGAENTL